MNLDGWLNTNHNRPRIKPGFGGKKQHEMGHEFYISVKGDKVLCKDDQDLSVLVSSSSEEQVTKICKLIAEAGTVANETGLTPRQLADLNKELLEVLKVAQAALIAKECGEQINKSMQLINNAIKKATL